VNETATEAVSSAPPERASAVLAALEELRTADRILMGVAGARARLGDQRAWDAMSSAFSWLGSWGRPPEDEAPPLAHTFEDVRQLNGELLAAQFALARVRAQLGQTTPEAVFELPLGASDPGRVRSVDDDVAAIEAIRARIRPLFAELLARSPLPDSVSPLEPLEPPASASVDTSADDLDHQRSTNAPNSDDDLDEDGRRVADALQRERFFSINAVLAALVLFAHISASILSGGAGSVVLVAVFTLPAAAYVLLSGVAALRGARDDASEVLERHALVISIGIGVMFVDLASSALFGSPKLGRHAPGLLTLLMVYASRLRAASGLTNEHELTVLLLVCVPVELGLLVRLSTAH